LEVHSQAATSASPLLESKRVERPPVRLRALLSGLAPFTELPHDERAIARLRTVPDNDERHHYPLPAVPFESTHEGSTVETGRREISHRTHAIIVSYNSQRYLEGCIESLADLRLGRITVWDNNSTDDSVKVAQQSLGSANVHSCPDNLGFGKAVNRAAEIGDQQDFILLVNPDSVANHRAFASCAEILSESQDIAVVAPRMVLPSGRSIAAGGPPPSLLKEGLSALKVDAKAPQRIVELLGVATQKLRIGNTLVDYVASTQ
jgi:hypothetical protein